MPSAAPRPVEQLCRPARRGLRQRANLVAASATKGHCPNFRPTTSIVTTTFEWNLNRVLIEIRSRNRSRMSVDYDYGPAKGALLIKTKQSTARSFRSYFCMPVCTGRQLLSVLARPHLASRNLHPHPVARRLRRSGNHVQVDYLSPIP